ncbi:MAG: hypothetical protein AB7S26_13225 [Sandaracinaceae bacterium]
MAGVRATGAVLAIGDEVDGTPVTEQNAGGVVVSAIARVAGEREIRVRRVASLGDRALRSIDRIAPELTPSVADVRPHVAFRPGDGTAWVAFSTESGLYAAPACGASVSP